MSLYSFPFTSSLCSGAESTHQCLLEQSIDSSPSQHVLRGEGEREESDMLRTATASLLLKMLIQKRCADLYDTSEYHRIDWNLQGVRYIS